MTQAITPFPAPLPKPDGPLLRQITGEADDLIAAIDRGYRLLTFNRAYEREFRAAFGVAPQEGSDIRELMRGAPADLAHASALWKRALAGERFTVRTGMSGRSQRIHALRFHPLHDDAGQVTGAAHVGREVQPENAPGRGSGSLEELERRMAERAAELTRANQHLAALSEAAALLLASDQPRQLIGAIFDRIGDLLELDIYFNYLVEDGPEGRRLRLDSCTGVDAQAEESVRELAFGAAVCGTVAQREERMVVEDVQHRADDMTSFIRQHGVTAYVCHPLLGRDRLIGTLSFGSRRRATFAPREVELLRALSDQVAIAIERTEAHRAAVEARARAEAASRAKTQFLAVTSHELRTPLTAIGGYVELLEAEVGGPLTEKQRRYLEPISLSARHLRDLIDEILTLSRIEAGVLEVEPELVDVAELVRETADLVRPRAQNQGLELRVTTPDRMTVVSDPRKLRQVLLNLLTNGLKFTETGTLEVRLIPDGAAGARLEVQDTGTGIPPEQLERIFEPFTQVDQSSTRRAGGAGLGLSVSRRLARLLGGELEVRSTPGEGSTFTLFLSGQGGSEGEEPGTISVTLGPG